MPRWVLNEGARSWHLFFDLVCLFHLAISLSLDLQRGLYIEKQNFALLETISWGQSTSLFRPTRQSVLPSFVHLSQMLLIRSPRDHLTPTPGVNPWCNPRGAWARFC